MSNREPLNKQAVIIIHGIGEQRPMDTLRSFVNSIWKKDPNVHHPNIRSPKVFSKPDNISGNFELRRLSSTRNNHNVTTDFFEYYWAHMMEGTQLSHIWAWLKRLIFTSSKELPNKLVPIKWMLITILILGFIAFIALSYYTIFYDNIWLKVITPLVSLSILPVIYSILNNIVGDAARYLDPSPRNVKQRQEIRAHGIEILQALHESNRYDRFIVVGHSLGSVIAYDILTFAWPLFESKIEKGKHLDALKDMTEYIKEGNIDANTFQNHQELVHKEQIKKGNDWRVSDLITVGSPLTYADVLLAKNKTELTSKIDEREFPSCPPQLDAGGLDYNQDDKRQLHFGAVFSSTKWTNIYSPPKWLIFGDIISGPVSQLFGKGVKDVAVNIKGIFTHTKYWKTENQQTETGYINALRDALDLDKDLS